LGTAWAVDERRLVASAAVVLALESHHDQGRRISVFNPRLEQEWEVADWHAPREYRQTLDDLSRLAQKEEEAFARLEQAETAEMRRQIEEEIVMLQERQFQAFERQVDHDFGTLSVAERLPVTLPLAEEGRAAAAGANVTLLGVPVEIDDPLADPESPPPVVALQGRILSRRRTQDPAGSAWRIVVKLSEDVAGQNWSGGAVLDGRGEVIGIYSRPTPPPFAPEAAAAPITTHDVIEIDRARALLRLGR
ncbi:MAG: hypothetical protein ACREJB_15420, partial [Planctomycetaceae bacterium]